MLTPVVGCNISSRNGANGLGAGDETVWGWWERFEDRGGNGLRGRGGNGLGGGGWGMGDYFWVSAGSSGFRR
mgnify:CR=1 FL=1